jgi:hypothetical protein
MPYIVAWKVEGDAFMAGKGGPWQAVKVFGQEMRLETVEEAEQVRVEAIRYNPARSDARVLEIVQVGQMCLVFWEGRPQGPFALARTDEGGYVSYLLADGTWDFELDGLKDRVRWFGDVGEVFALLESIAADGDREHHYRLMGVPDPVAV